nr:MAG TPA: hypothetical protein [Caudoviricetes sp.]
MICTYSYRRAISCEGKIEEIEINSINCWWRL